MHKEQITACVRAPGKSRGREQHVAEFKTTVQGPLACRDWLQAHDITHIAMEAPDVYWKPVWAILEDEFECLLVNARHVKQAGPARAPNGSRLRSPNPRAIQHPHQEHLPRRPIPTDQGARGHHKAIGAVKHSIIIACWHMLTTGELYNDLGGDYFTRCDPDRQIKRLVAQLERLGQQVNLQPTPA